MEPNKELLKILKTEEDKYKIIIDNIIIMLSKRIYIDKDGKKKPLLDVETANKKKDDRGDNITVIKTNNGDKYAAKIIFSKITSTGKQSVVSEFFKDYADYKKIFVATDFNNKISDYMSKHRTQIFKEFKLLVNIIDHRYQPKFELLSPAEMKKFKLEYNATDYTTKKLLKNDAITHYFALQKGDIIRLIRPSPTSGQSIDYRIVS